MCLEIENFSWIGDRASAGLKPYARATKAIVESCRDLSDPPPPTPWPTVRIQRGWPSLAPANQDEIVIIGTWVCNKAVELGETLRPADGNWSRRDFQGYFNLIFQGLASAAPDVGQGKTLEELINALGPKKKEGM